MYAIFWEPNGAETAYNKYMGQFLSDISGSTLAGTMVDYSATGIDGTPSGHPGPQITLSASWVDTHTIFTAKMTKADFRDEVRHAMFVNHWSSRPGNVFLVFTGKGWNFTGLSEQNCGYHSWSSDATNPLVFAAIPRPTISCTPFASLGITKTPSGSIREDTAVDVAWHEVAEMLTDPLGNGYFDHASGKEIGDVCRSNYPGRTGSNNHDITLNGHQYLVQAVWVNSLNKCSLDAPLSASPVTVSATQGTPFNGTVATFTDPDSAAKASDFSALVTWSDGSFWSGTVQQTGPGAFSIAAAHTFTTAGSQTIKVAIHDNGGSTGTKGANATVASPVTVTGGTAGLFASLDSSGDIGAFTTSGTHLWTMNVGGYPVGMTRDAQGNLYVTDFSGGRVIKVDVATQTSSTFASGLPGSPESLAFDGSGHLWVGAADTPTITELNTDGSISQQFTVATEDRGTDWIDFETSCVLRYTSEGSSVLRYDVCTGTQLAPLTTGLGGTYAYAVKTLPDGSALVADSSTIVHLATDGSVLQTYSTQTDSGWFALALDPGGQSFWAQDYATGDIVQFDLSTGNVLNSFNDGFSSANTGGLAIG